MFHGVVSNNKKSLQYIFIINLHSGKQHRSAKYNTEWEYLIAEYLEASQYVIEYVEEDRTCGGIVKDYLKENVPFRYIAVGGDGTVNEIAKTLLNTDMELAIIPKGSGNGLARTLSLPLKTREALEIAIYSGKTTKIDSCSINNTPFFCTAGIGLDAKISNLFADSKKRGFLSYIELTIQELSKIKVENVEITIDNKEVIQRSAVMITLANASQYGNNFHIAPNATLSDGFIDVTIITNIAIIQAPIIATLMMTKTSFDFLPGVETFKCKTLKIVRTKGLGVIHCDGDAFDEGNTFEVNVIPDSLRVVLPLIKM